MNTRKFILLIITAFSINFVFGQEEIPDMITDRPDQTESSISIPKKTLQIETGFVFESDNGKDLSYDNMHYMTTLLRYGLFDGFEVRLSSAYSTTNVNIKATDTDSTAAGMIPIVVGFKSNITQQKGFLPEMAIMGSFSIPKTGTKDFQLRNLAADIRLAGSWAIIDGLGTGINVGAAWSDDPLPIYFYTWVVGVSIVKRLNGFVELYGHMQDLSLPSHKFDAGITYLIRHNLQFDVSAGMGISEIAPDYFINGGIAWRIPK